jgi:uncharacterized protein YgiM (DUF1202 family)
MPRTPLAIYLPCLAALICFAALSACAAKSSGSGGLYVVYARETGFYKYGPAQTFGADFTLPEGTRVTMLQNSWGFAHVMTADGTSGYVSSDDLRPAPLERTASTGSSSAGRNSSTAFNKLKHSYVRPTPGSPLFEAGELPLPENSEPPKPAPGFRF